MKLESGKRYVTRGGMAVGPMHYTSGMYAYPFGCNSCNETWTEYGVWDKQVQDHPLDIVSEYTEPQQQELRWRWMKPDRPGVWAMDMSTKENGPCADNAPRMVWLSEGAEMVHEGWFCRICDIPDILPPERVTVLKRLYVRVIGKVMGDNVETRWFDDDFYPSPDDWTRTDLVQEFTE